MRTNVDSLAVEYALEKYPEYLVETSENVIDNLNEESYQNSKEDFKAGFEKCYELVKPLLQNEDIADICNDDLKAKIKEFLAMYEPLK